MRLDVFLAERALCDSRTDAKKFIVSGNVTVDGKVIKKPSYEVSGEEEISVDRSSKKYVGRGGFKLRRRYPSLTCLSRADSPLT